MKLQQLVKVTFLDTEATKHHDSIQKRLNSHIVSCARNKKLGKRIVHGKNPRAYVSITKYGLPIDSYVCKTETLDA